MAFCKKNETLMNGLLVRVGADQSSGGGAWNGPIHSKTGEFLYVAIPEGSAVHDGCEKPYSAISPALLRLGISLPVHLSRRSMHLDPDFEYLTYGDQGERAKQIRAGVRPGDAIAFYASLLDIKDKHKLVYAIIGLFVVEDVLLARDVPAERRIINAHSRRILREDAQDIIVCARPGVSGRLQRGLPIGEYRNGAYRVRASLLEDWGGLNVKDGYLQRSARLPRFLDTPKFLRWLKDQKADLLQANN
jgi:hypothetical protein